MLWWTSLEGDKSKAVSEGGHKPESGIGVVRIVFSHSDEVNVAFHETFKEGAVWLLTHELGKNDHLLTFTAPLYCL